jgi:uncharacterized protein YggU (UPF0235/DUF167 family)
MRRVRVLVFAGAKKQKLIEEEGRLVLYVREPAERNLANKRAVVMIAEHFGVAPRDVRIQTGHRAPNKIIELPD